MVERSQANQNSHSGQSWTTMRSADAQQIVAGARCDHSAALRRRRCRWLRVCRRHLARATAMRLGQRLRLGEAGEAFPVLHHLAEAEAGAAQGGGDILGQRQRGRSARRLPCLRRAGGLAGEGAAAERGPFADLVRVAGAVAQREQRAVQRVGIEIEQAGLVDQAAGFDQLAGAGSAFGGFEFGFLFGEAGFLLFVRAQALGQRADHGGFPYTKVRCRESARVIRAFDDAIRALVADVVDLAR